MITVSEKAASKIKEVLTDEKKPDWSLRIGVKGGGCSGFTYALKLDKQPMENDQVFEVNGVKIIVDPKSLIYLTGTELDYMEGLDGSGFIFNNPNANRKCGCGNSFSA